jgi:chemotaxis methyl-accepting protein methylase
MNSGNDESSAQRQEMLAAVITVMGEIHGRDLSVFNESFLAKSLEKRQQAAACANSATYLQRLAQDAAEAEAFHRSLRVVYSEFFRNPLAFALLEQVILTSLIEGKSRSRGEEIRIWSAGCAAGQEAWSVAMLLDELATAGARPVPYRIFATDLSAGDLDLARRGVYSAAAVDSVRLRHLNSCFSRQGETYAIAARLRDRVDFSLYDLLDSTTTSPPACIYGNFDLVLCSNVLLYYRPEILRLILNKLRRSLAPGGYLITGETERQMVGSVDGFRAVAAHASVFRRIA